MANQPIRYGIAGLGRSGWNIHANQIRSRSESKLVAVVDPIKERRQEAIDEFSCRAYENFESMLEHGDLDVVVVATPSVDHARNSIAALEAGKHVICEKPMAMNLVEADLMIQTAENYNQHLFIHQNYRFQSIFTHLQEVINSGVLGDLYHIRNYNSNFARRDDWQTLAKNGGGVLNNKCTHNLDMIMQLMGGKVETIMGDLQQIASGGDVEDHVKAFLKADNGCTADMEVTSAQNIATQLPTWILCGTTGTLTNDGKQSTIRWFDPSEAGEVVVVEGAAKDRAYGSSTKPIDWHEKIVPAQGPNIGSFYDNVTAVLQEDAKVYVTPQSVREVLRVMTEIRRGTNFEVPEG